MRTLDPRGVQRERSAVMFGEINGRSRPIARKLSLRRVTRNKYSPRCRGRFTIGNNSKTRIQFTAESKVNRNFSDRLLLRRNQIGLPNNSLNCASSRSLVTAGATKNRGSIIFTLGAPVSRRSLCGRVHSGWLKSIYQRG